MSKGMTNEDMAVKSGHWLLYRYNPELAANDENPLKLDSKEPTVAFRDYAYNENRFRRLLAVDRERAERLIQLGQQDCDRRWKLYSHLAAMPYGKKQ